MKRTLYGTECDALKDQRKVSVAGAPGAGELGKSS